MGGFIGLYPTGGATWDYIQYPLGLQLMGHDVYYVEDTMLYPVYQKSGNSWNDPTDTVLYLTSVMKDAGLQDRWAYRDVATGRTFGLPETKVKTLIDTADILINVSCSTFLKDEYLKIPIRILIDSDPMFTQIKYYNDIQNKEGKKSTKDMVDNHNYLFSFGENINSIDCEIPTFDYKWYTTRQPICTALWENSTMNKIGSFTSIMNWSEKNILIYKSKEWGQKDIEFEKFKTIPQKCKEATFEIVINKSLDSLNTFREEELTSFGWNILDPHTSVETPSKYRKFIQESLGEFSVAKETYVKSKSGWFSCRSACYLASGKPVVTQDTMWSRYIPSGEGLFAFTDLNSAMEALEEIKINTSKHKLAAKELAKEYFDSNRVLQTLLKNVM